MNWKRASRWAAEYFLVSGVFTAVGLGLVAVGALRGGLRAYEAASGAGTVGDALAGGVTWLALVVAGLIVWRLGAAIALHRTLTGAVEEELDRRYSTERMKSEVLDVLDGRLSEMQDDIQSLEFSIEHSDRTGSSGGFEFGEESTGGGNAGSPEADQPTPDDPPEDGAKLPEE
jgi:hypothetical protein